jgi:hypothetical protein
MIQSSSSSTAVSSKGKFVRSYYYFTELPLDYLDYTPDNITEMRNCVCGTCIACISKEELDKIYRQFRDACTSIQNTPSYHHCDKFVCDCENHQLESKVCEAIIAYEEFKTSFRCEQFGKTLGVLLKQKFTQVSDGTMQFPYIKDLSVSGSHIKFMLISKNTPHSVVIRDLRIYIDPDMNRGCKTPNWFELSESFDGYHPKHLELFQKTSSTKRLCQYLREM